MRMCVYIEINNKKDYRTIKNYFLNNLDHILTDIKAKSVLIENPIIYKDDISSQIEIK